MSIGNFKKGLVLTLLSILCITSGFAQATFEKGKLYHLYATGDKDNVVYEKKDKAVGLTDLEDGNAAQFWKISELSGSCAKSTPTSTTDSSLSLRTRHSTPSSHLLCSRHI